MGKKTPGRRLPDCDNGVLPDLQPGDYWKLVHPGGQPYTPLELTGREHPSNLTGTCWHIAVPNPCSISGDGYLLANLVMHTVREHEDGTISVKPGDGSSNSILVRQNDKCSWHGYVDHGVLEEC